MNTSIQKILDEARNNKLNETKLEIHERLYGLDSCFLVSSNYHGYYHDDYADFTYYSNVTGEYFKDNWTTAAVCPNYDSYINCKKFDEAKELGLINISLYNEMWQRPDAEISEYHTKYPQYFLESYKVFPYVEVFKGRLHKNRHGYLIGLKHYVRKGYSHNSLVIYDDIEDTFFVVNPTNVRIASLWKISVEEIITKAIDEEMNVTDRIHHFNKASIISSIQSEEWKSKISTKYEEWDRNFDKELEMINLRITEKFLQWVKDHFSNVTDENEIRQIAINIAKKKKF